MSTQTQPAWAFLPGVQVHVSSALPLVPSDAENARRLVRHGYASARAETGEAMYFPDSLGKVGPEPGEETHAVMVGADSLTLFSRTPAGVHVSRTLYRRLVDDPKALLGHVSRADLYDHILKES